MVLRRQGVIWKIVPPHALDGFHDVRVDPADSSHMAVFSCVAGNRTIEFRLCLGTGRLRPVAKTSDQLTKRDILVELTDALLGRRLSTPPSEPGYSPGRSSQSAGRFRVGAWLHPRSSCTAGSSVVPR